MGEGKIGKVTEIFLKFYVLHKQCPFQFVGYDDKTSNYTD